MGAIASLGRSPLGLHPSYGTAGGLCAKVYEAARGADELERGEDALQLVGIDQHRIRLSAVGGLVGGLNGRAGCHYGCSR